MDRFFLIEVEVVEAYVWYLIQPQTTLAATYLGYPVLPLRSLKLPFSLSQQSACHGHTWQRQLLLFLQFVLCCSFSFDMLFKSTFSGVHFLTSQLTKGAYLSS